MKNDNILLGDHGRCVAIIANGLLEVEPKFYTPMPSICAYSKSVYIINQTASRRAFGFLNAKEIE